MKLGLFRRIFRSVVSEASSGFASKELAAVLKKSTPGAREQMARHASEFAAEIRAGKVDQAAEALGEIVGEIKW